MFSGFCFLRKKKYLMWFFTLILKVSFWKKKNIVFLILPKNEWNALSWALFSKYAQDSELHSFFERIENSIDCFRDLLTFSGTNGCLKSFLLNISPFFLVHNCSLKNWSKYESKQSESSIWISDQTLKTDHQRWIIKIHVF